MPPSYILITRQPGAIGSPEVNAYGSDGVGKDQLETAGHLLADGAEPPMTFEVLQERRSLALRPAKWDEA